MRTKAYSEAEEEEMKRACPRPEQRENASATEELHMLSAKVNLTLQWESMGTQEEPSQFPLIFYVY